MFSGLFTTSIPIERYEPKKGIGVSTVDATDCGPETALLDANGAHPVERYSSIKEAKKGHLKWVKFAKNPKNKKVLKLGQEEYFAEDKMITLKRIK